MMLQSVASFAQHFNARQAGYRGSALRDRYAVVHLAGISAAAGAPPAGPAQRLRAQRLPSTGAIDRGRELRRHQNMYGIFGASASTATVSPFTGRSFAMDRLPKPGCPRKGWWEAPNLTNAPGSTKYPPATFPLKLPCPQHAAHQPSTQCTRRTLPRSASARSASTGPNRLAVRDRMHSHRPRDMGDAAGKPSGSEWVTQPADLGVSLMETLKVRPR